MRKLTYKDFDIQGNNIRAYYDSDGKLVFVLDYTTDEIKTNVLLVINPVSNRKWDDILSNDYGVDLETIRPKRDNLYQKLDIDYTGLREYSDLISAFEDGQDIEDELNSLLVFRQDAVKRIALDRLDAAQDSAEKARETIEKTNDTIIDLQVKLKELKAKLSSQKKQIGKEPTKQSAAKILRTEAQIDIVNDKIKRAKKRITNAEKRLLAADEEIELVRRITETSGIAPKVKEKQLPVKQQRNSVVVKEPIEEDVDKEPVYEQEESKDIQDNRSNILLETEDKEIKDEDKEEPVKPLFDKDPEILNEEIAFKPISFDSDDVSEAFPVSNSYDESVNEEESRTFNTMDSRSSDNLVFTPPTEDEVETLSDEGQKISEEEYKEDDIRPLNITPIVEEEKEVKSSVLDSLTAVDSSLPSERVKAEENITGDALAQGNEGLETKETNIEEVRPVATSAVYSGTDARPVSPISGNADTAEVGRKKPNIFFYIMLFVLIVLSIFTLWMYQKNTGQNSVPDIAAVDTNTGNKEAVMPVDMPAPKVSEVAEVEPTVSAVAPVVEIVDEPVLEPVEITTVSEENAGKEEIVIDEGIELLPVTVQTEPVKEIVVEEEPVVLLEPVVEKTGTVDISYSPFIEPEPEEEIVTEQALSNAQTVDKPAYNVSQQENMFVAGTGYETDNDFSECIGGALPDVNGCCPGETFSTMSDGTYACCSDDTGECFPPL